MSRFLCQLCLGIYRVLFGLAHSVSMFPKTSGYARPRPKIWCGKVQSALSEVFISSVAQKQLACQVKILKPLCTSTFCCHALKKHIQMWGSWLDRVGKQNSSNIP